MGALPQVRGYVLAGGGSTRFGSDKALAEIGGKPMVARMCELLGGVTKKVTLVAAPEKYSRFGVRCIADRWAGEGPLGGIVTALLETAASDATCEWNLVVSCDMPFLTSEWLAFLVERAHKSDVQAVLPSSEHGPEPLCACYRTDAADVLRAEFAGGVRKITDALKQVKTEMLDESDWKRFDSAGRLFWNMNTAADCEVASRVLEKERE